MSAAYLARAALPSWAEDILRSAPVAGQGVHDWLFRASLALWRCGRAEGDIRATLRTFADGCGRRVAQREIEDAIRNSGKLPREPMRQGAWKTVPAWPAANIEQVEAVIAERGGLVDLWEASPLRFDDPSTEEVIDLLFPGNPWLCAGARMEIMETWRREDWRGRLGALSFIVPNPMTAATGINQSGVGSARCLDNTGARRFLVIECDFSERSRDGKAETPYADLVRRLHAEHKTPADAAAAVLMHLGEIAPLALAVFSGGKSVHGWFHCEGIPEDTLRVFMRKAVVLGADRATWTRCQAVRMPDGLRDGKTRQGIFYFNPEVIQ